MFYSLNGFPPVKYAENVKLFYASAKINIIECFYVFSGIESITLKETAKVGQKCNYLFPFLTRMQHINFKFS